jgi:hypothetical protein
VDLTGISQRNTSLEWSLWPPQTATIGNENAALVTIDVSQKVESTAVLVGSGEAYPLGVGRLHPVHSSAGSRNRRNLNLSQSVQ